jgi:hypothetical protein
MITTLARTKSALDTIVNNINSAGVGSVRLFTGAVPADLATVPAGTLVVNAPLLNSAGAAFGAATSAAPITATGALGGSPSAFAYAASIAATGTVTFWRIYDQAGAAVFQGSVGLSGSGAEMILNTLDLVAGGTFRVNTFTITLSGIY